MGTPIIPLLVVGFVVASLHSGASSDEQIYRWCADSPRCALAYHIDTAAQHNRELFRYLVKLRLPSEENLHHMMLHSFGYQREFDMREPELLRQHWVRLLLSEVPYCDRCGDAVSSDVGVQCEHSRHQLVFDTPSQSLSCKEIVSSSARSQTTGGDGNGDGTERWHTSAWTNAAIWILCVVGVVYLGTKTVQYSLKIREYSKQKSV